MTTERCCLLDNKRNEFARDIQIRWVKAYEDGELDFPCANLLPHLKGTTTFLLRFADSRVMQVATDADVTNSAAPTVSFRAAGRRA